MDIAKNCDPNLRYYCYLRASKLLSLTGNPKVLDALLADLKVDGLAHALKLPTEEKFSLIEHAIEHKRTTPTSQWYGCEPPEILAAAIYTSAKVPRRLQAELWCEIKQEAQLSDPVKKWLSANKYVPYEEIPMGTKRVDVLGYRRETFFKGTYLVAVELKNDLVQMQRGLDQMTTYRQYAHEVWLACTPALAAAYLQKHASGVKVKRWDFDVLRKKLEGFGFGLMLVEESDRVVLGPLAKTGDVEKAKLQELLATIHSGAAARV
jgi:hypothetical protein